MSQGSLLGVLQKLAAATQIATRASLTEGKIRKQQVPILKNKVEQFSYNDGNISFSMRGEPSQLETWGGELTPNDLVSASIKPLKEFGEAVTVVSEDSKDSSNAEFLVTRFSTVIVEKVLQGAEDDEILDTIVSCMNEIEDNPVFRTVTLWLVGIWLEEDSLELGRSIKIRRTIAEDLENEAGGLWVGGFPRLPSVVLTITREIRTQAEMNEHIERTIAALRLFKLGSVYALRTFWYRDLIKNFGGGISFGNAFEQLRPSYRYPVRASENKQLESFINTLGSMIPDEVIVPRGEVNYLVIAMQRFNDAMLKPDITESKISFGIMTLEALYLKEKERQELEHRLGQRVARTLGTFGLVPLEVFNDLRRAYEIRSSYVHGSPIPKEHLADLPKLAEQILEYARSSIVIMLQLKQASVEKEKFLNSVENALLNKEASSKLDETLTKFCPFK